jgi:hypothetical protein
MIFVLVYQNEKYWLKPEYHQSAHTNFAINIGMVLNLTYNPDFSLKSGISEEMIVIWPAYKSQV